MPEHFDPQDPDFMNWLTQQARTNADAAAFLRKQQTFGPFITPEIQGDYLAPDPPKKPPQYRQHIKTDQLEIRGHVLIGDAEPNDVVFTILPVFYRSYPREYACPVETSEGNFVMGRAYIAEDQGDYTLWWPVLIT